jgi:REP element-mobilizing transposase RayT
VHVTLRSAVRSLRTQFVFPSVRGAISAAARALPGFRVVEFSVQGNHLHLLVEAASKESLSSGMRGLAIRIARRVNQLLFRRGRFWADRWHGRALTSPRAVRHALVYVLHNAKKHGASSGIDPYSSAPYFCGYKEFPDTPPIHVSASVVPVALAPPVTPPVLSARTWLLRHGWLQRHGPLSVADVPKR